MRRQIPGTHKTLSVKGVQGILGILSYELSNQGVASKYKTAYAIIFKFNKSKTWGETVQ